MLFFFQAEDGIRDLYVTGVQTCALPICQERENGRIVERKIDVHHMIELTEDLELDPAKIQPSIEAALSRAIDWLKKQQIGRASWRERVESAVVDVRREKERELEAKV